MAIGSEKSDYNFVTEDLRVGNGHREVTMCASACSHTPDQMYQNSSGRPTAGMRTMHSQTLSAGGAGWPAPHSLLCRAITNAGRRTFSMKHALENTGHQLG